MSGKAAKEHVRNCSFIQVQRVSVLVRYFLTSCSLSTKHNRTHLTTTGGPDFSQSHVYLFSFLIAQPYCHGCGLYVTSHLAIMEQMCFCVIILCFIEHLLSTFGSSRINGSN